MPGLLLDPSCNFVEVWVNPALLFCLIQTGKGNEFIDSVFVGICGLSSLVFGFCR
jgi:hypothetical protein